MISSEEFRLNQARALVDHYAEATGMGCRLTDPEGKEIYRAGPTLPGCEFCQSMSLRSIESHEDCCAHTRLDSLDRSARFGGGYVYACPSGFVFWTTQLYRDKKRVAGLIGGGALLFDYAEYINEESERHYRLKPNEAQESKLKKTPLISTARLAALAEILFLSALAISDTVMQDQDIDAMLGRSLLAARSFFSREDEAALIRYVEAGDEERARALLTQSFSYDEVTGNKQELTSKALELSVLLSRVSIQTGSTPRAELEMNARRLLSIQRARNINDVVAFFQKIVDDFCQSAFRLSDMKHGDIIAIALKNVREHFPEDLTLEDAAKIAGLSGSYFSRIFKMEMGVGYIEYLNKIRVDESKRLLTNTNLELAEIATKCGFTDQSYYTKIFKKNLNVSPGRYRASLKHPKSSLFL